MPFIRLKKSHGFRCHLVQMVAVEPEHKELKKYSHLPPIGQMRHNHKAFSLGTGMDIVPEFTECSALVACGVLYKHYISNI